MLVDRVQVARFLVANSVSSTEALVVGGGRGAAAVRARR